MQNSSPKNKFLIAGIGIILCGMFASCANHQTNQDKKERESPRIVNIVNFIRQCEPRIDWITEDVLYETVVSQIDIMNRYQLKGSFLLQYDALMDSRYQELLKQLPKEQYEIGAWWEIPQILVENSGYNWRGRYPWDWHANVGFATGYSPEEREKLVDTYMKDFKDIFGYYPRSVGSWFIDAHTLSYLWDKYQITASCNCKDQIGTDGYTLWGGYWNQAYYPSKKNAYMPAQNPEQQIPVPVFRMLGSDPIYQYDNGLGGNVQRVVSLEPVYSGGGGSLDWCDWYFRTFVDGAAMAYGYVQTGQENSFTWKRMQKGFEIQMPMIADMQNAGEIEVMTLAEAGSWFRNRYEVTPPTAVTVLKDHSGNDLKTLWFNSRFYRANLLWEKGKLRFRDIHTFDEKVESDYLREKGTSTQCNYFTLPVIDGFRWSSKELIAGMRFMTFSGDSVIDLVGGNPVVDDHTEGVLNIRWETNVPGGVLELVLDESSILISGKGKALKNWFLELSYDPKKEQAIAKVEKRSIEYSYHHHSYSMKVDGGSFERISENIIRLKPDKKRLCIDF